MPATGRCRTWDRAPCPTPPGCDGDSTHCPLRRPSPNISRRDAIQRHTFCTGAYAAVTHCRYRGTAGTRRAASTRLHAPAMHGGLVPDRVLLRHAGVRQLIGVARYCTIALLLRHAPATSRTDVHAHAFDTTRFCAGTHVCTVHRTATRAYR